MRLSNKPNPHYDSGEWYYPGGSPKERAAKRRAPPPAPPKRGVPKWFATLVLSVVLACIAFPPLFTALVQGLK